MSAITYLDTLTNRAGTGRSVFEALREPWMEDSLCRETDPEAFFPEKGGSTREAKKVCLSCDVRSECLEYALGREERFGIWGGLSERERRKLKRRRDGMDVIPMDSHRCGAPGVTGVCKAYVREEGARCRRHPKAATA